MQSDTGPAPRSFLVSLSYFGIGLLFAVGLAVAGMTQPSKVLAFLDFTGEWDPSLGFVMAGGIAVHLALYKWILQREAPLMGIRFGIPTSRVIDARLLGGAALFGVGWALSGYCPGPGLVSAGSLHVNGLLFVAAMLVGMQVFHSVHGWWSQRG